MCTYWQCIAYGDVIHTKPEYWALEMQENGKNCYFYTFFDFSGSFFVFLDENIPMKLDIA